MLKKKYRLKEREVKMVLHKWEPFFSYNIVLNKLKNKKDFNRFAIIISAKSTKTNVERNFFRRRFYDFVREKNIAQTGYDFVFVVKNKTKLDKKSSESLKSFFKDLWFLINKI